MTKNTISRHSLGGDAYPIDPEDLLAIQIESFRKFEEEELPAIINGTRIETRTGHVQLHFDKHSDNDLYLPPTRTPEECIADGLTYQAQLFVELEHVDKKTGESSVKCVQALTPMPLMTERGTFVVNGVERVLLSRITRCPGVMFVRGDRFRMGNLDKPTLATGTLQPESGTWLRASLMHKGGEDHPSIVVHMSTRRAARGRQGPRSAGVFRVISAVGLEDRYPGLCAALVKKYPFLNEQYMRDKEAMTGSSDDDAVHLWAVTRSASSTGKPEAAKAWLEREYFGAESPSMNVSTLGRQRIDAKLQPYLKSVGKAVGKKFGTAPAGHDQLVPEDILGVIVYLAGLYEDDSQCALDDQENFANKRIETPGRQMANAMGSAMAALRMPKQNVRGIPKAPADASEMRQIVRGRDVEPELRRLLVTGKTSERADQKNPLISLSHARRITSSLPGNDAGGGKTRAPMDMRDVHFSHYGRICPIETPEGQKIGLIGHMASLAGLTEEGMMTTPYRVVKDGVATEKVVHLSAADEQGLVIAQADSETDEDGQLAGYPLCRRAPAGTRLSELQSYAAGDMGYGVTADVFLSDPESVDLMDVSPVQTVSVPAALIPFLEHDDPNRALMGANMQKQAVPLIRPEAPFVGTGMEGPTAAAAGCTLLAPASGWVTAVRDDSLAVRFHRPRLSMSTDPEKKLAYDKAALEKAPEGDILFELTKFGRSNDGTAVNWRPVVKVGDRFEEGDVLADGPAADRGELALGKNVLTAYMLWGGYNFEDAIIVSERLVSDDVMTSIHLDTYEVTAKKTEHGDETITDDNPMLRSGDLANLDDRGIIRVGAEVRPRSVLVSKITPKPAPVDRPEQELLEAIFGTKSEHIADSSLLAPHGVTGTVVSVRVLNEAGGFDMKPGELEIVQVLVAKKRQLAVGDKLAGRHGNKGVISKIVPTEDMPHLPDGTPVDIILSPLGVPSRMNVGQLLETSLGYASKFGFDGDGSKAAETSEPAGKITPVAKPRVYFSAPVFDGAAWDTEDHSVRGFLEKMRDDRADGKGRMVGNDGKSVLIDGRTGKAFDREVTVGWTYMLKLEHLVDGKLHARSTGPVSRASQQPTGGKSQFGGQRFGEMEVWALESHGAAATLHEILTYKSDDIAGAAAVHGAIVHGGELPDPGRPETFNMMVSYLRALGVDMIPWAEDEEGDLRPYSLAMPSGQYSPEYRKYAKPIHDNRNSSGY